MKISIRAEGHRFVFYIPLVLIKNKYCTKAIHKCIKKYTNGQITENQINMLCDEFRAAKKTFKHLLLIDVQSSEGERVKISL